MLYKHLKQMEKRPGLYLCKNVNDIYHFMSGYESALHEHGVYEKDLDNLHFNGFRAFVKNHYGVETTESNELTIINENSTDADSFDTFFKLFNEFVKSNT